MANWMFLIAHIGAGSCLFMWGITLWKAWFAIGSTTGSNNNNKTLFVNLFTEHILPAWNSLETRIAKAKCAVAGGGIILDLACQALPFDFKFGHNANSFAQDHTVPLIILALLGVSGLFELWFSSVGIKSSSDAALTIGFRIFGNLWNAFTALAFSMMPSEQSSTSISMHRVLTFCMCASSIIGIADFVNAVRIRILANSTSVSESELQMGLLSRSIFMWTQAFLLQLSGIWWLIISIILYSNLEVPNWLLAERAYVVCIVLAMWIVLIQAGTMTCLLDSQGKQEHPLRFFGWFGKRSYALVQQNKAVAEEEADQNNLKNNIDDNSQIMSEVELEELAIEVSE
jgi:hypothetical protein